MIRRSVFGRSDPGLGVAQSVTATMVDAQVVFTVSGGPILILELLSECITANDTTASTLQWASDPTIGAGVTGISGASASLASVAAGTTIRLSPTALTTAPVIVVASSGGVQLGTNVANRITVQPGTIQMVIGVGSTTGTWRHYIAFIPLAPEANVV